MIKRILGLALISAVAAVVATAPASAEAVGPALAAPATAQRSHALVPEPAVDLSGTWAEHSAAPTSSTPVLYVVRLKLSRDGRFEWINGYK
ncbi:hypothetical protein ACODT3_39730 [Streptomyces sp. 4.24]|uniref:hypothetical protein n=1 Tax=Streptomyces tritrimontium TaxID=3406573 RepID=UPI003BB76FDF